MHRTVTLDGSNVILWQEILLNCDCSDLLPFWIYWCLHDVWAVLFNLNVLGRLLSIIQRGSLYDFSNSAYFSFHTSLVQSSAWRSTVLNMCFCDVVKWQSLKVEYLRMFKIVVFAGHGWQSSALKLVILHHSCLVHESNIPKGVKFLNIRCILIFGVDLE